MDAARAAADALCAEKNAALVAAMDAAASNWAAAVATETEQLNNNTAKDSAECDASAAENRGLLQDYRSSAEGRFASWAADERAAMDAFVAECEAAW